MREIVAEKGITFEQFEEFKKRASSKLYSLMSVTGTGDFHLLPDGDRLYNAAMRVVGWPDPDTGELTLAPQAWVQRKIMAHVDTRIIQKVMKDAAKVDYKDVRLFQNLCGKRVPHACLWGANLENAPRLVHQGQ